METKYSRKMGAGGVGGVTAISTVFNRLASIAPARDWHKCRMCEKWILKGMCKETEDGVEIYLHKTNCHRRWLNRNSPYLKRGKRRPGIS